MVRQAVIGLTTDAVNTTYNSVTTILVVGDR